MTTKLLEFAPKGQRGEKSVPDQRPWKLRFLIFAGLLCFVWYQVAKQLGWLN